MGTFYFLMLLMSKNLYQCMLAQPIMELEYSIIYIHLCLQALYRMLLILLPLTALCAEERVY